MRAFHRLHLHLPLPQLSLPGVPFLLLAVALLLVAGAAVASVVSLHDPGLAAIVAVAGLAGILGAAVAYIVSAEEEPLPDPQPLPPSQPQPQRVRAAQQARQAVAQATLPRPRVRIQSLPVANLPPAYLAAVRKGAEANRAALKARADRV